MIIIKINKNKRKGLFGLISEGSVSGGLAPLLVALWRDT
jgi:hypothetical protein